jgi:hypothetical protein
MINILLTRVYNKTRYAVIYNKVWKIVLIKFENMVSIKNDNISKYKEVKPLCQLTYKLHQQSLNE